MNPDAPRINEADAERLMTARGEILQALDRARASGCDAADLLSVLGDAIGVTVAGAPKLPPVSTVMLALTRIAHRGHAQVMTDRARAAAILQGQAERVVVYGGQRGARR